jgi:hypothetical protein
MLRNMVDEIAAWFARSFPPQKGLTLWLILLGLVVAYVVIFFGLQFLKPRARKTLIAIVTFLAGLFYALEFFLPTELVDGKETNALTRFLVPMSEFAQIVAVLALGLGIYSLTMIHGKTLLRFRSGWFYSLTFFTFMIMMATFGIIVEEPFSREAQINKDIRSILFVGGLQALEGTMFSIIAFYIVSAAYRAFRVRNAEASLLMAAAFIVMLGQVYVGQFLTNWLPTEGVLSNLRIETMSDWLLTRINAPAVRAVGFGLGVGLLATALRIWLSLERGSYFDREV